MSKPKLCIECVHGGGSIRMTPTLCHRPLGETIRDPVTGATEDDWIKPFCQSERRPGTWLDSFFGRTRCGPGGQFYEYVEPEKSIQVPPSARLRSREVQG